MSRKKQGEGWQTVGRKALMPRKNQPTVVVDEAALRALERERDAKEAARAAVEEAGLATARVGQRMTNTHEPTTPLGIEQRKWLREHPDKGDENDIRRLIEQVDSLEDDLHVATCVPEDFHGKCRRCDEIEEKHAARVQAGGQEE